MFKPTLMLPLVEKPGTKVVQGIFARECEFRSVEILRDCMSDFVFSTGLIRLEIVENVFLRRILFFRTGHVALVFFSDPGFTSGALPIAADMLLLETGGE